MAIQIGKYKRPGIFIEEFDNSVITAPTVEGIKTTVVGFSRKGPVNTPVLLQNLNDLEKIFGPLDRNLERKGSYFHRTVSKMLESSPVFAINLLATDDILDTIEYKSLSSASDKVNDVEREGPYRRFFDTTGFWKRDTESFINLTKPNTGYEDRVMSFTNLSDKFVTIFVFKSTVAGFDRTMLEWYGAADKIPTFVNQTDYASDYMVDVLVVGGDWTNYQDLSVDPRWSAYFNNTGLRKEQVRNFANDRNVTLLNFYEGLSLIPYFRDEKGTNIFIETVVNRDTDKTGLYCAFNSDLLEQDFPTGLIDLIGNNLVVDNELTDLGITDIEFLSYKETIVESILFSNTILDRVGNVNSIDGGTSSIRSVAIGDENRTGYYAEGFVNGLKYDSTNSSLGGTSSKTIQYSTFSPSVGTDPYAIIGSTEVDITPTGIGGTGSFTMSASSYQFLTSTASYISTFVLNTSGNVVKIDNLLTSTPPVVATSDIVLGYISVDVFNGQFVGTTPSVVNITVDSTSYKELTFGTASDYTISDLGSGSIKVEFLDTASTIATSDYVKYRKLKTFNSLINKLDSPNKSKMSMLINVSTMEKRSLENMTITSIVVGTTQNKSFVLNTGLTSLQIADVINGTLLFYTTDDEFIIHETDLITKNTISSTQSGIVAKYSDFYIKYNDGTINTGDFFYGNISSVTTDITFADVSGNDYIIFSVDPVLSLVQSIIIPDSVLNKGAFVINSSVNTTLTGYVGQFAYLVVQNTVAEELTDISRIYDSNLKHYLQMFLDNSNNLSVKFMDSTLVTNEPVDVALNQTFRVQSNKSNFKQSIEIEVPAGYVQIPNKILINGSRYTEVKVGDFLEAYVDESLLESGQVAKRLTRILSKRLYSLDTTLVEVTCDARISKVSFGGDLQTLRYTTIDNYATTYKGISMKGFRVRQDSMPDGTEEKQNAILNLVAKGTPIFKALTNKEAIDFRYLVDAFGLGLAERSKQQLVDICGDRLDCFGFISMPSMRSFKNSTSPSFVDSEGVLQTEFIAKGGDPESSPAFLYSFGEGRGTSATGYFLPYLTVNDNGRPLDVPPAMFVATTYMRKHNSNLTSIVPWTVSAGVTNGKITGITTVEQHFGPEDIEFLNQAQMNPIVFKRNRGHVIETENTAQTLYKSSLSYIHSREVLIELERELSSMLLDFQWKVNTPETRAELKLRADVICERFVAKGGLFNFFNKSDEENNTPDIIQNQIGVLDTFVEIGLNMGIIVNNVTILRTGAIQSGGFQ